MYSIRLFIACSLAVSLLGGSGLAFAQTPAQKAPQKRAGTYQKLEPKSDVKPEYKTEEPLTDTRDERTRLQRPGEGDTVAAPPVAPNMAGNNHNVPPPSPAPMPLYSSPTPPPPADRFPTVGQLEQMMFGHASPTLVVETRLEKLENSVFQKSYNNLDTETRIHKLKEVLVGGTQATQTAAAPAPAPSPAPFQQPTYQQEYRPQVEDHSQVHNEQPQQKQASLFENYQRFDMKAELSQEELDKFALLVVNEARTNSGLAPLDWNELAHKVAVELIDDLTHRQVVSHHNKAGENPDVRYTKAGGTDAMEESLIMFPNAAHLRPTRELVVRMLEALNARQDDHDALFSAHGSGFGMSFGWSEDRKRLICSTEVITAHGTMEQMPLEANVGEKVEVKGTVAGPYQFQKITLAWEGDQPVLPDDGEESGDALPYFPPLDYEAHAAKSEHDWEKGMRMLQIAGITAAIAGGFFMPPVALAAPLIAASAANPKVKPVSDIPVKGGVKTDGQSFSDKITLSHDGKDGIYYITVWAMPTNGDQQPVAVSRRAVIAHNVAGTSSKGEPKVDLSRDTQDADSAPQEEKKSKKEKKAKGKKKDDGSQ